jgi:transposase
MIYVGIDVAKDKHDCIIVDSDGVIRFPTFTIPNNKQGFRELLTNLKTCGSDFAQIKVGLEATGHYSDNLLEFLIANDLPTTVINPLHTNLYRKGLSLRKTKTDTVDAHSIVTMLRTECLKPYSKTSYHVRELKSLTRYRFSLVQDYLLHNKNGRSCKKISPVLQR